MRFPLLSCLVFLAACADAAAPGANGMPMRWDVLLPVRDAVYLGDNPPACADGNANMLSYRRDRTLAICTGSARGWQPVLFEE